MVLLIAIIRVNTILRKNYPKLKTKQLAAVIHISVGVLMLSILFLFNFDPKVYDNIILNYLNKLTTFSYELLTAWIIY